MKAEEVNCSSLRELIDNKIHNERNRDILKRRLIDGVAGAVSEVLLTKEDDASTTTTPLVSTSTAVKVTKSI